MYLFMKTCRHTQLMHSRRSEKTVRRNVWKRRLDDTTLTRRASRGGAYPYDSLDRLFGLSARSFKRIV